MRGALSSTTSMLIYSRQKGHLYLQLLRHPRWSVLLQHEVVTRVVVLLSSSKHMGHSSIIYYSYIIYYGSICISKIRSKESRRGLVVWHDAPLLEARGL